MKNINDFQDINKVFELFEKSLYSKNNQMVREILESVSTMEEIFLDNYYKKKKEGVYYTDTKLSDFIFTQALLLFLNNKINPIELNKIEDILELTLEQKKEVANILLNSSVFDPACGSGVFLLSAASNLFKLIKNLDPQLDPFKIKTLLIQNLFGHDINEFALKLCILKLSNWYLNSGKTDFSQIFSILKSNIELKNSLKTYNSSKYDIIIGNPPYGNILTKEEKDFLKNEKIFYNDIYCAFLIKALEWSKGIIGLLVPKSFLLRQGYIEFRNQLFSNASILKIFDIGSKQFKKATNEVQIIIYKRNHEEKERKLEVYDYPDKVIINYSNQQVDLLKICLNPHCPLCSKSKKIYVYTYEKECPYCKAETVKLNRIRIKTPENINEIIKIIEIQGDLNYLNIKDFPKMIRGEEDIGLRHIKKNLRDDMKGTCAFVNAKDDFHYYYIDQNKSFNIEDINENVLKGSEYEYYKSPKLLIKHNNIIPEAIYTEDNICFTSSIYSLLHEDIGELKYLCAYINSILNQFYCTYGINNQKGTTINLNQYMIRHLPILKPNEDIKAKIIKKVDKIINYLEINNGIADENVYRSLRNIDDIIFSLYGLGDDARDLIILNIKNQINHFENIYNSYSRI